MKITPETIIKLSEMGFHTLLGHMMLYLARRDADLALIYSDCGNRFQVGLVEAEYPEKCYEVGIAEQNQLSMATAMSLEGYHTFALAYAPFITARVLDQVRVGLGYMKAPVKLIGLGAGFSIGDLGATHMALEDIAAMRGIPNMIVMSPADCLEMIKMLDAAATLPCPAYIRITPAEAEHTVYQADYPFEIGVAVKLKEGRDVLLVATGAIVGQALEAACILDSAGIDAAVLNMHTIKPLDTEGLSGDYKLIVTVEEHSVLGGLGGAVAEHLSALPQHPPLLRLAAPDAYFCADTPARLREKAGLTALQMVQKIRAVLAVK